VVSFRERSRPNHRSRTRRSVAAMSRRGMTTRRTQTTPHRRYYGSPREDDGTARVIPMCETLEGDRKRLNEQKRQRKSYARKTCFSKKICSSGAAVPQRTAGLGQVITLLFISSCLFTCTRGRIGINDLTFEEIERSLLVGFVESAKRWKSSYLP
jgi:hypothetical protein